MRRRGLERRRPGRLRHACQDASRLRFEVATVGSCAWARDPHFCESIGETPSDPAHAEAMEDGELDLVNNDPWYHMELPRA